MAALVIETVRNLLSQFTFQIVSDGIVEDLSCISCRKLSINPYQTHCGCIYCDECVTVNFGKGNNYCNGGREDCREEYIILEKNVLKNAVLNENILRLKVRCPNRSCDSVTELTHMSEHLRVCSKQLIKRTYSSIGCDDDGISKDAMLTHLHETSIKHSEILVDLIQNPRNKSNELKENFNQTKLDIPIFKEESRMNEVEKEQLMNEMKEVMNTHHREIEFINKTNGEMIRQLEERIQKQENEFQSQWEVILIKIEEEKMECNNKMVEKEEKILQLEKRMQKQEDKLQSHEKDILDKTNETEMRVDGINIETNTTMAVGRVTFKVGEFSAAKTSAEEIYSPRFYSHTNGYKLRLLLYPGGVGGGRGTHVSVYIVVCKGEYDDLLEWPCMHSFTISIVNQRTLERHMGVEVNCSTTGKKFKYLFDKPIEDDNLGYGYCRFIAHTALQSSHSLVVDDALLIRCVVTPPP